MRIEKARLKKSVERLTKRAEECFDAAEAQHVDADKQHADAEQLVTIGKALEADAIELNGEIEFVAARTSPELCIPDEVSPLPVHRKQSK